MRIAQHFFSAAEGWHSEGGEVLGASAQLVLVFGSRDLLEVASPYTRLRTLFPAADIVMASTAGEIAGTEVSTDRIVVTAVAFERTRIACAATDVADPSGSVEAGKALARALEAPDLMNVFVVSDGTRVNGTELTRGLNEAFGPQVVLTGGLAGDGTRFEKTLVGLNGQSRQGQVVAVGFYGRHLQVGHGHAGGWAPFGPVRTVTRSRGNLLYELDGRSALQLYKNYLGDEASHLPGSAFRFPLSVSSPSGGPGVVRTILSIDEPNDSMTFAGDIPAGSLVRFMRASYEDLIEGAASAAEMARRANSPGLILGVSCVGRLIVLGPRVEEEAEIVLETLGPGSVLAGFYSYGELSPSTGSSECQLHNQTMTLTTLREE